MWRAQNEVLTAVLLKIQVFGNVKHATAERRVASQKNCLRKVYKVSFSNKMPK